MKLEVRVKTNSKENKILLKDGIYTVYLHSMPIEGRANTELIKLLSKDFNIPQNQITITHGLKSKVKLVEIKE